MFKRILEKVTMPKITLPTVKFSLPSVKVPTITIPIKKIVTVLGIINTSILITIGGLGLFVSYINPIPWITPYIQFSVANQLFEYVQYLQANSMYTIGASSGLIVFGLLLHVANFKSWWKVIKATPMAIVRSPLNAYRKTVIWRNWILAKINYLNEESAKRKTFFKVQMPLILPGVISGALFAFITSFDEVVIVFFLAGFEQRTIPRQMWAGIREQISPTILAVATILVLVSILLLTTVELLRRRSEKLRGISPA